MAATTVNTAEAARVFQQAIDKTIRENGEVGMQVTVYHDGQPVVDAWGGIADETTGRKVDGETLFPSFSVIKATTATALHIQAERGLIEYEKPIAEYWSEFAANGKAKATIRDALSHRLGIPYMPEGVTPAQMSDYAWMVDQLAKAKPIFEPGTANGYMCYTFGWVIAECVQRTDPQKRPFRTFVREELLDPLGIRDIWIGISGDVESRVARLKNAPSLPIPADAPILKAMPPQVATVEEVFGRADMRRGCIPGAHGIMNARSSVRLFAMLANGGELDGVRLLSEDRVKTFSTPRKDTEKPDSTLGIPVRMGTAGFWLGGSTDPKDPFRLTDSNPRTLFHPGAGGAVAWGDPDACLAVAICHNGMSNNPSKTFQPIRAAVEQVFGVS
jgi:CubicO group peptidase (beta-lactamase class C family)